MPEYGCYCQAVGAIAPGGPIDPDDPTPPLREYRIYGDDNAQTWVVVDEVDYHWAVKRKWHINKPHPNRNGTKQYFCHSNSKGGQYRGPKTYLHVEIMKRSGIPPPDQFHTLVGHLDNDEWNCRRENLAWLTPKKNRDTSIKSNENWKKLHARQRQSKSRKNVQAC